jgi:small basic protein
VTGLVNALKFPDMSTFQTVVTILINLLSVLLDINNRLQLSIAQLITHAQFVGNVMTTALLQSLGYKHGQEHYPQVLLALSTIYQYLSPPSEIRSDTKTPSTQERPDFRPYFLQVFAQLPNSSDKHIQVI